MGFWGDLGKIALEVGKDIARTAIGGIAEYNSDKANSIAWCPFCEDATRHKFYGFDVVPYNVKCKKCKKEHDWEMTGEFL